MKKYSLLMVLLFLLFSLQIVLASELYQQDSLTLSLNVDGEFTLSSQNSNVKIKDIEATLQLYPQEDVRQKIQEFDSQGKVLDDVVQFSWNDQALGTKTYSYSTIIKTTAAQNRVREEISFPLSKEQVLGLEQYLLPTETIDSNNPAIIAKATELVEGEEDLFKATFILAEWIEKNVQYELTSLTETASQKASWVLQSKQGVCDEMTSLFVAMARAVGIPARFVTGISYTTSDLFDENWQPHGWAEVYFPDVGWVPFDVTFGEYGYIDPTHIKLRDSFDPVEPATKYLWTATQELEFSSKELNLGADVLKTGKIFPEEIQLEQEIEGREVGFGSYNLIRGILKNTADYYTATTLQLATPTEVEVLERNRRTILLGPKEVKETYWVVKVPENLQEGFVYSFPTIIYSEKNVSVYDLFTVQSKQPVYTKQDMQKLIVQDEDKSYSRKITFTCQYAQEMKVGTQQDISCAIKNSGNSNLNKIKFCVGSVCEVVDLPINQEKNSTVTIQGESVGWQKIIISAENDLVEKHSSVEYVVIDDPVLTLQTEFPAQVVYGEMAAVQMTLEKTSFTQPQEVIIIMQGEGFTQEWKITNFKEKEILATQLESERMGRTNEYTVTMLWKDKEGKHFSANETVVITVEWQSFKEKMILFFNSFVNWFR